MIDTRLGKAPLSGFLREGMLPDLSLAELIGDSSLAATDENATGLMKRFATACATPLSDISCGHVRMLIGQRFGLEWLAAPVAIFVAAYPAAECDLYPGDLTCNAFREWRELLRWAPVKAKQMLCADFSWMRRETERNPDFDWLHDAQSIVEEARRFVQTQ